ncbi:hypothetical protein HY634_02835 [Candidatus Uhrbacteria bacterium]|nr:hypothetical protein [Candidatus Uhrbacteria bacterium]
MSDIRIVTTTITRDELRVIAGERFGDLVKAVVDLERRIMAIGGELHADEEQVLLDQGSKQQDLWGINFYPDMEGDAFLEFDSMINVRPSQGNRSRSVEDPGVRQQIRDLVASLVRV